MNIVNGRQRNQNARSERRIYSYGNRLPQRNTANDEYYTSPLVYRELDAGELAGMNLELEGDFELRQFTNFEDDEGEEGLIAFDQIIVLEVAKNVIFPETEEAEA